MPLNFETVYEVSVTFRGHEERSICIGAFEEGTTEEGLTIAIWLLEPDNYGFNKPYRSFEGVLHKDAGGVIVYRAPNGAECHFVPLTYDRWREAYATEEQKASLGNWDLVEFWWREEVLADWWREERDKALSAP